MAPQIVLNNGRVITGALEPGDIPSVKVSSYIAVDTIAQRLDEFEGDWQELAQELELDITGIKIDLILFFDDLRRMFGLPEKHPEKVD